MDALRRLKPGFWDYQDVAAGAHRYLFNFRRIWKLAVFLTSGVALVPLISMAMINYRVMQNAMESEILLHTSRLVSNTRRTLTYFLEERKFALDFIDQDNDFDALNDPGRLAVILENLKKGFGGFVDLGVIGPSGLQKTYVGPYNLEGKDYSQQEWFGNVLDRGVYISDVFLGFRQVPHLVIAVKHDLADGSFYVLRATLDTERCRDLLDKLEVNGEGDAFVINREGIIQTPSRYHGRVLEKCPLPVPRYSPHTQVFEWQGPQGAPLIVGYAYVSDTPFILMIVKQKGELMKPSYRARTELIGFLAVSTTVILLVILGVATYLVGKIHLADQKRVMTLHQVEYANKMASIGRLAAGVAHEINNPLAVINEKAGLIKDLFSVKPEYAGDPKLRGLIDSIISSVGRCAVITRRLLNFARHADLTIQPLELGEVIREVLGFLGKEAEYRSIDVFVDVPEEIPPVESDRGKLQEIFLNLFNNAFAALSDGGRLVITAGIDGKNHVLVKVSDNGCGIPEDDLKRVFEPFFSTRAKTGGTGLGLSITYGLVQELGGAVRVESEVGKGTTFFLTLPLQWTKQRGKADESPTGG
ncbi:MAG: two-component sensor histidine kinase [Deltaproteobacteria bacterium]|nr:two-component sensor histidine kinase [Deltaproteobacteria bacterium]